MTRFLVRWLQHAGQLLSEAVTGRRLSFALLLATLGAHLVCVWWVAGGGVAAAVRLEASLPLAASGALAVAMFAMRRIVRVRAATIARAAAALIAIALLDGPPVFVPALLVAPLLIEPVLYDDDRVGMALGGACFAAALAVLATRAPAGPPATAHYLATFALVTGLPSSKRPSRCFRRSSSTSAEMKPTRRTGSGAPNAGRGCGARGWQASTSCRATSSGGSRRSSAATAGGCSAGTKSWTGTGAIRRGVVLA